MLLPSLMTSAYCKMIQCYNNFYQQEYILNCSIFCFRFIRFWNLVGDVDPEGIAGEDEETLSCCYSPSGRCVAIG